MTATDEVQLETEAKARLAPPPRWPPTAIGAGALPLPPRRQQPRATPRRLYLLVYLIRRPGLRETLATGLMLGAFAAITRLGPHPFSLRGVVPILTAGAVFGMVVAAARRSIGRTSTRLSYALLALAGAAGGTVWWLMLRPPSALLMAALLGAFLAQGVVAFELWLRRAAAFR